VIRASSSGHPELWVAGTTLTNVFYVARKLVGAARARDAVSACLGSFKVAAVNEPVLKDALALGGSDFEDDVQVAAARAEGLDGVLTRDPKGFASSPIAVWDPTTFRIHLATL
jgi:hypothetical protein